MRNGTIAIIPARYGSQRLPGKPLLKKTGKYLIQHVYENVKRCRLIDKTVVATDDERILEAVRSFGGEARMTSPRCATGTDRVAEAAEQEGFRYIVNVQGDEPEIEPAIVGAIARMLKHGEEYATLATPFDDGDDPANPQRVKVVLDEKGYALYFSRSPIPGRHRAKAGAPSPYLLHIGIYGYSLRFLRRFVGLPTGRLERAEGLEQLRALEHGEKIKVSVVRWKSGGGVDTMRDYLRFVRREKLRAQRSRS